MNTAEFLKRYQEQLDSLPYGLGDKIAAELEERDALIEKYKPRPSMVNLAHDLCGIDYKGKHEPFKFQNEQLGYREHWSSIGRENRED